MLTSCRVGLRKYTFLQNFRFEMPCAEPYKYEKQNSLVELNGCYSSSIGVAVRPSLFASTSVREFEPAIFNFRTFFVRSFLSRLHSSDSSSLFVCLELFSYSSLCLGCFPFVCSLYVPGGHPPEANICQTPIVCIHQSRNRALPISYTGRPYIFFIYSVQGVSLKWAYYYMYQVYAYITLTGYCSAFAVCRTAAVLWCRRCGSMLMLNLHAHKSGALCGVPAASSCCTTCV